MRYQLIFAGAALAQLAQGRNHGRDHRQFHKRDVVTDVVTEVDVVTEIVYVTEGAPAAAPTQASALKAPPAADGVRKYTIQHSHSAAPVSSASSAPAYSAPPPAYSTHKAPASSSAAPVSSAAPSSSAAAPSYSAPAYSSSSSPAPPSSSGISHGNMSPNGKKAGLSGYIGIGKKPSFQSLAPYISWYSDYSPNTPDVDNVMGVGMLWGADGSACSTTGSRLQTYSQMTSTETPKIMFGFYEPDCTCEMSSEMSVSDAAKQWDSLIAPLAAKGTILGSPSMCKQKDEDFLTPFNDTISKTWDVTSIHINKPDLAGAKEDVEYYVKTYGKKVWVSEFACVNDQPGWSPCTDRTQITNFINDVVKYFEGNDDVVAYGPSNGEGLGDAWPLTDSSTGELTETGKTYLNAIKGL